MKNNSYIALVAEQTLNAPQTHLEIIKLWQQKGWAALCTEECEELHITEKGLRAIAFLNDMTVPMILIAQSASRFSEASDTSPQYRTPPDQPTQNQNHESP